ncbi:unnamed protein product [Zymoseptoria tritici ST99CH_1A5]|uniref:Uncharacterized protein n=1 Tax=Zymoseptoria tritici ST99CH_1A5 TaxID=1276529 RepID=A0A1Y6LMG0_ZYMTR|nr:unnamed protein product [Zymoseptoria tritici ST99CH_1A5]
MSHEKAAVFTEKHKATTVCPFGVYPTLPRSTCQLPLPTVLDDDVKGAIKVPDVGSAVEEAYTCTDDLQGGMILQQKAVRTSSRAFIVDYRSIDKQALEIMTEVESTAREHTASRLDSTLTLRFVETGTLEDHIKEAIEFMRKLGYPVQEVHRYSHDPQGGVIFTPAKGYPEEDEPLYEALMAHFESDDPFIVSYGSVDRETAQEFVGVRFKDRAGR